MTKEKFGSILLSELRKRFPSVLYDIDIEIDELNDYIIDKKFYDHKILNSDLRATFIIDHEYNDVQKTYYLIILCKFKKVPDSELTNKFTIIDHPTLEKMPMLSLEPSDFNKVNPLIEWDCRLHVSIDETDTILIPKSDKSYLFEKFTTLNQLLISVSDKILSSIY